MGNVGPWELIILLVIVLLVFGAKRLPEIGRSMGKGMREFKDSVTGKDEPGEIEPPAQQVTATAVEEDEPVPVGDRDKSS
jgi:sec-independent protein translocase protein TatA